MNINHACLMKCPVCGHEVTSQPLNQWYFNEYKVSRYKCPNCGEKFNLYDGETRTYTIPKRSKE